MVAESILWVEDEAYSELQYIAAPVVVAGFDLHVAGDASQAVAALGKKQFSALVVDIRIGPGHDQRWIELYYRSGAVPAAARLGIHLLRALLLPNRTDGEIRLRQNEVPDWLTPKRCAVFSVEVVSDFDRELMEAGLKIWKAKGPELDAYALLDLIKTVLKSSRENR
jgi:hypothetical protein